MVKIVAEEARAMLIGVKLNEALRGETVLTVSYLINNTSTRALE